MLVGARLAGTELELTVASWITNKFEESVHISRRKREVVPVQAEILIDCSV